MTTLDSASPQGTEGTPIPSSSDSGNGQPSSDTVNLTKAEYDKLQKRLERLESEDRSAKDRAVKNTNKRIEDLETKVTPLLERAAEIIKDGKSPQDALQQAQKEQDDLEEKQLLRDFLKKNVSGKLPTESNGNATPEGVKVADVIKEYNLDGNDPEVIAAVISKNFANETEAKLAAANIALRRLNSTPPNPAASTASVGTTAQQGGDLKGQYERRLDELQKMGRPNPSQIADLKSEFRKKGLEVW